MCRGRGPTYRYPSNPPCSIPLFVAFRHDHDSAIFSSWHFFFFFCEGITSEIPSYRLVDSGRGLDAVPPNLPTKRRNSSFPFLVDHGGLVIHPKNRYFPVNSNEEPKLNLEVGVDKLFYIHMLLCRFTPEPYTLWQNLKPGPGTSSLVV